MRIPALVMMLLSAAPVLAQEAHPPLPFETVHSEVVREKLDFETVNSTAGWFHAGSRPQDYEFGTGVTEGLTQERGFFVKAKPEARRLGNDFGTMMRNAPAEAFRGKRVQLAARMKSENAGQLQLWLRVDGDQRGVPLAFYNMVDRAVRGTSDWKRYEVVLDVPEGAQRLAFGFFVAQGRGLAWAEDFHVEEVGREVPVSVMPQPRPNLQWDNW